MAQFVPYMDKENSSQTHVLSHTRDLTLGHGPVGKTFQSHSHLGRANLAARQALKNVNTRDVTMVTTGPRKALGGLNMDPCGPQQARNAGSKIPLADCMRPPAPASKPKRTSRHMEQTSQVVETVGCMTEAETYPEIEHMPQYDDDHDDSFSDLWAPDERPDNYIQELRDWRPARLYPLRHDQDCSDCQIDDSDSLIQDTRDTSLQYHTIQDLTVEEPELMLEEHCCHVPPELAPLDKLDMFIARLL